MIKAVIFDMDGVIVDSEPIESLAWEKVLAEYDKKPIFNSWGLIHAPGVGTLKEVVERHGLDNQDIDIIRSKKRKYFEEIVLAGISPMPGLLQLLKRLKKEKIKVAVASGRNERHVKIIIHELGFDREFDEIIGFSEDVKRKPAPDAFLKAANKLGIKQSMCVAIEDTENGVISAKTAGMKVIAVPNKWTAYQNFSKADKIVNSLSEISLPMLKSL